MYRFIFSLSFVLLMISLEIRDASSSNLESIGSEERLFNLYLFGKSHLLHIWEKRYFGALGILHFFTPSGLHFSSLLLPVKCFLNWLKVKPSWKWYIKFFIILPFAFLDDFHSLRRVAIFCTLYLFIPTTLDRPKHKPIHLFFIVFLVELVNFRFHASPFSFTFSFLFWGSILAGVERSKFHVILYLIFSQCLVIFFQNSQVFPINLLIGQSLTLVFTLIFPLFILAYASSTLFSIQMINMIPEFFHKMIYLIGKESFSFFSFNPNLTFIIWIILPGRWKVLGLLLLSFNCGPLFTQKSDHRQMDQSFLKHKKIKSVKYGVKKMAVQTQDGLNCHLTYRDYFWKTRCYLISQ